MTDEAGVRKHTVVFIHKSALDFTRTGVQYQQLHTVTKYRTTNMDGVANGM